MQKLLFVIVLLALSVPAMAHGRMVVRVIPRPVYVPSYRYYAPRPVFIYRPPMYHYRPAPIYVAPPVYQPAPVYINTPAPRPAPQPTIQLQIPDGFAETGRRYHSHGSDAGTIDWVKGTMPDGRRVKIEYNFDGTRKETKAD